MFNTRFMNKIASLFLLILLNFSALASGELEPRSQIKSYSSALSALSQEGASQYFSALKDSVFDEQKGEYTFKFKVPFSWVDRYVILHLGAINSAFALSVNGKQVGEFNSSFTPVEIALDKFIVEGANSLTITLKDDENAKLLENFPRSKDIIGGDSYVLAQPKVRVVDINYSTEITDNVGLLSLDVLIKTELLNDKKLKVYYELYSPDNKLVNSFTKDLEIGMLAQDRVVFLANVKDVLSWSHAQPNLYRLCVKTQMEGRFLEYVSFDLGFSNLDFKGGDMFINGAKVDISSYELEPDLDYDALSAKLDELKREGVNFLAFKHHPANKFYYTLADRKGFYVQDQVAIKTVKGGKTPSNNPALENEYLSRTNEAYRNSKNHVSVVAYNLATDSENGYNLYQSYTYLKDLKPRVAVVYHDVDGQWNSDSLTLKSGAKPIENKLVSLSVEGDKITVTNLNKYNTIYDLELDIKGESPFNLNAEQSQEFTLKKSQEVVLKRKRKPTFFTVTEGESDYEILEKIKVKLK